MEAKAIKFVKIIRRKLMSDPECQDVQLEKLFLRAVEKLPDGDLKSELEGNLPRYRKLVKHKRRVLQQNEAHVLSNLGGNVTKAPSGAKKRKPPSLEQRKPTESKTMGKQADFSGPAELQWLADLRWNVTLTCARSVTNKVLQTTMKLYTSKLAQHLTEDFLQGLKPGGLEILAQELKRFLHFCNHCCVASEEFERPPTYHDLMAAMVSVYVDILLLLARSKVTEDHRQEAKQLVNTAMYLFRRSPGHVLDVLLQQTQATPGDSAVILPLYTRALQTVNVNSSPVLYTKYMLTARQAVDLFKQESVTLLQTALQLAAPAGYSEWLRDQAVSVPETEFVSGVEVSRVLLEECDTDTVDLLMDLLTEDTQLTDMDSAVSSRPRETTDHSGDQDQSKTKTERTSEGPLFFIDKEATSLPIELQPSDVDLERVVEDDDSTEAENQDALEEEFGSDCFCDMKMRPAEDEDVEECVSSGTTTHRQDFNDETLPVTPDRRTPHDTKRTPHDTKRTPRDTERTSSVRKSLKKSIGKKTPQRDTMDVDDGEFTDLRSCSKESPKPAGSQKIAVTPDQRTPHDTERTPHDTERTPRDTERTSSVRKSLKKSTGKKTPQRDTMDVDDGEFTGLRSCQDSPKPAESQTVAVTPDQRTPRDTERTSSVRKSLKKSAGKKNPQRDTMDVDDGEFTDLRSCQDSPKPAGSQTVVVTPDRRAPHDTKRTPHYTERTPRDTERTSSVRKSLKKSAGKKTPQRDTMDVDDGEFTGLRSCKDSPKPSGSQTVAVTPDQRTPRDTDRTPRDTERTPRDTKRTSSVKKSLKKSTGKKTPQRDTMDVDGEFTDLRSCQDSPKPAGSQTVAVTPDQRTPHDTKRTPRDTKRTPHDTEKTSSVKKSLKKSTEKKTPQRDTMDVDDRKFTGLKSRSKESPKQAENRVCEAPATPGNSGERQRHIAAEESDDGSVIIVSAKVARRRSCRIRRRTQEVEHGQVEEGIKLREQKKPLLQPLKDDTETTKKCDQVASRLSDDALFFIDKKASMLTVALSTLPEMTEGVSMQTRKYTPRNRRRSGITRVLSSKKSQQHDRSSKKTPVGANKEVDFIQLDSSHSEPVSWSSPVLPSGGKRARKSSNTSTQVSGDLDDSWVVIDTPERKRAGVSKCPSALERVKGEEVLHVTGKTQVTPKAAKRDLHKNTPVRTPATAPSDPTPTRKRKSLVGGETPKKDISKRSPYSLRRKSMLAECRKDT